MPEGHFHEIIYARMSDHGNKCGQKQGVRRHREGDRDGVRRRREGRRQQLRLRIRRHGDASLLQKPARATPSPSVEASAATSRHRSSWNRSSVFLADRVSKLVAAEISDVRRWLTRSEEVEYHNTGDRVGGIQRSMSSSRCPWRICTTSQISSAARLGRRKSSTRVSARANLTTSEAIEESQHQRTGNRKP